MRGKHTLNPRAVIGRFRLSSTTSVFCELFGRPLPRSEGGTDTSDGFAAEARHVEAGGEHLLLQERLIF